MNSSASQGGEDLVLDQQWQYFAVIGGFVLVMFALDWYRKKKKKG